MWLSISFASSTRVSTFNMAFLRKFPILSNTFILIHSFVMTISCKHLRLYPNHTLSFYTVNVYFFSLLFYIRTCTVTKYFMSLYIDFTFIYFVDRRFRSRFLNRINGTVASSCPDSLKWKRNVNIMRLPLYLRSSLASLLLTVT